MRMGLVIVALLAGCGGQGVDLEVTSDVAFDRVELFLANDICYDDNQQPCDQGVAWKTGMVRPAGDVFVTKDDENVIVAVTHDDTAVLHLEAVDEFREPKVMAIVGFKSDVPVAYTLLSGVRIPANSAETWRVELEPADLANEDISTGPSSDQSERRVFAWKRENVADPSKLSRCLAMQFWDDGKHEWVSKFIVPDSDHDCDGQEVECDPLYANFNAGAPAAACVDTLSTIASNPCAIGSSRCEDGVSSDPACSVITDGLTCVPDALCTDCEGQPDLASCVVQSFKTNDNVGGFACDFSMNVNNATCGQGKAGSATQITLPAPCTSVEVRSVANPLGSASGPPDVAMLGTAEIKATLGLATGVSMCAINLDWVDGLGVKGDSAAFVLLVSNQNVATIAVPVRLTMGTATVDCNTAMNEPAPCQHTIGILTDSMFDCLR